MKHIVNIAVLIIYFFSIWFTVFASYVEVPTWFKLIKAFDPNKWATELTFSFNESANTDRYYIYLWSEIWNYTDKRLVDWSPATILKEWKAWDVLYAAIQWANIWYDSWESKLSEPIKIVIEWELVNTNNVSNNIENIKITKLPTTWPEHILLGLISFILWWFIMLWKKRI
jgi:hypothetical protein